MTNMVLWFFISLTVMIISAIAHRIAIPNFCYSTIAEAVSVLTCGTMAAGAFLVFFSLPSLLNELVDIIC